MEYEGLNNQEYWTKRTEDKFRNIWKNESLIENKIKESYLSAIDEMQKELSKLYSEFAKDGILEHSDVKKFLTVKEMQNYRNRINDIRNNLIASNNEMALLELEKLSKFKKISRLSSKINQIHARLIQLGVEEEQIIKDHLSKTYEDIYNHTLYEIQTGTGLGFSFNKLNAKAIETSILYPWSGSMFSDLIWDNKNKLIVEMRKSITDGLLRGESYRKMASNLHRKMSDKGYKDVLRLIRTETAHVVAEASYDGYEKSGIVRQYYIVSTLDSKTSNICQEQDSKVYNLVDKKVGINYPPFHPNCRTSIAPKIDGQVIEKRRAKDKDGKSILVDRNMTYKEWAEKYLEK